MQAQAQLMISPASAFMVIKFMEDDGGVLKFLDHAYELVDAHVQRFIERKFTHMMVSFGCTGGQHRSVYCAEHLATHLAEKFSIRVRITHRELEKIGRAHV